MNEPNPNNPKYYRLLEKGVDQELVDRFWEKCTKDDPEKCWEWQGARRKNKFPYGLLSVDSTYFRAHRLSYIIHFGEIPAGMLVMHKCDNPPCVNPNHLRLGTEHDNHEDCYAKGRYWRKDDSKEQSPLTREQIWDIRCRFRPWIKRQLAAEFNVSIATVGDIVTRRTWRHI